jgi:glycosyltransferase involved in cell wall biosynthesis
VNPAPPDRPTVAVIVDKDGGTIGPSETFLRAHIDRLPFRTVAVIGNPGSRRREGGDVRFLQSRSLPARGWRWALDRAGVRYQAEQDADRLSAFLRRHAVEVVLAEYGPTAVSVLPACRRVDVPLVTHFHGWDAYVLAASPELRGTYREVLAASAAVIAVSRHMRAHLVRLGASADRVVWNPCGAEVPPLAAAPGSAPPRFVSIGRSTPKKALVVVLLAFREVLSSHPDARLDVAGGAPDPTILQLTRALDLTDTVTFHGPQPHERILALLHGARCYVHPSVTAPNGDMEGTPVSVLEAMAAGLPVVATRHGGILDVLGNTGGGVLVEEYDVAATAAGMRCYAADPRRAQRDGAAARRAVEETWSMEHSLSRLAAIVDAARRRDAVGIAELAARATADEAH